MKIYVFSPPYSHKSAGIKAMHYFMYLLQRLGHTVFTDASETNEDYDKQPIITPYQDGMVDAAVMPEVVGASVNVPVFRWVLYFVGFWNNNAPRHYGKNEICYHWLPDYKQSAIAASYHKESTEFSLPLFDRNEYIFEPVPREGNLLWVYKGKDQHAHPADCKEITRHNPLTRLEFLNELRTHKALWSYDRFSSLNIEAALSGVDVKLWNYDKGAWDDYVIDPHKFMDIETDTEAVRLIWEDFTCKIARL